MKKSALTVIGLLTFVGLLSLNWSHAKSDYGIREKGLYLYALSTTGTTSTDSTEATKTKSKVCRGHVPCHDVVVQTSTSDGCIMVFGQQRCGYEPNNPISYSYEGEKENCTGGSQWYDCNACQEQCIPTRTDF